MDTVPERPFRQEGHSPEVRVTHGTEGRVFVHHDGALGDVLLSLSCLREIRAAARFLHLVSRPDIGEFLQQVGLADETSRVDSLVYSQLYADLPPDGSCGVLSSFDLAYLFTAREAHFANNLRQCNPDVRVIRTIPPADTPEHVASFRLRQCSGGGDMFDSIPLTVPEIDRIWAERLLADQGFKKGRDRPVVMHPGSGGLKKCWPLRDYLDLIHTLFEDPHLWCVVLSGPAEPQETISSLQILAENNPRVIHLHQEPLSHIAALLSMADYYLGNDSGISHLAGAMHCRGIVLFGPTDPQIWRPVYEGIEVIQFEQDGDLSPVAGLSLSEMLMSELNGI